MVKNAIQSWIEGEKAIVIVRDRSIGTLPIDYFLGRLVVCAQCIRSVHDVQGLSVYKPLCVETHRLSLHPHTEP